MPTYNILKIHNVPAQLEMASQRDRLSQEFVKGERQIVLLNSLELIYSV